MVEVMSNPGQSDPLSDILRAVEEMRHYDPRPMRLVMHPHDWAKVKIANVSASTPEERIAAQKDIADAYGLSYWIAGVDGYRAPFRIRWHPRNVRRRWVRKARRFISRMPGVTYYGSIPRKGHRWMYDGPTERIGRWFVHVGPFRVGTEWDDDPWRQ